ncbi:MAG: transporter substrate-binding protein [Paenibacillus sp.]|nr:transporter substrate-binding protein [Paenibacillus sp.]
MKKTLMLSVTSLLVIGLVGCSDQKADSDQSAGTTKGKATTVSPPKPVTIKIASTSDVAYKLLVDAVAKKYPHITLQSIKYKDNNFSEMLASGDRPDLIEVGPGGVNSMQLAGLDTDHRALIKESDFDFSKFKDGILDYPMQFSQDRNKLVAMYMIPSLYAMYYNKDLFDRFAIAYPKDGLTWNESIDLARRLTATEQGIVYRGIQVGNLYDPKSQLNEHYIDPVTDKSAVNTPGWKMVFETLGKMYQIPGNVKESSASKAFTDKRLALFPDGNRVAAFAAIPDLNWDMTTYPVFESRRGYGPSLAGTLLAVTSISENKSEAFKVAMVAFSNEIQEQLAKEAKATAIKGFDPFFAKGIAGVESKNLLAVSQQKAGNPHGAVRYKSMVDIVNTAFDEYVANVKDVNTALREVDDLVNPWLKQNPK